MEDFRGKAKVKIWRLTTLVEPLKLRRHHRRLIQQIIQFFPQPIPIRVHAILRTARNET
jgi:hypothetical protein